MNPYFSIIIPVYRDLERLILCLDSFNAVSHPEFNFEIIVVNNDPANPVLGLDPNQYTYSLMLIHELIPGSYAARNKGIKESKGKILGFTDSDCIPSDDWLVVAFNHFSKDENQGTGILTGPVPLFFKNPNCLSDVEIYEKYTGFTTDCYAKEGHAITANWFSYKSLLEEFGNFNESLKSNGDSELSGQISLKYKIVYDPNLIVNHPARYYTDELVNKYKRLIGGTYHRKFQGRTNAFRLYILDFIWRRYRFALKKFITLSPKESLAIFRVCNSINKGVLKEYFHLVKGGDTKR